MAVAFDADAYLAGLRAWRVVPDRLRHWARIKPDARFVQCESPWLTFAEVNGKSDRIAAGLHRQGLRKGDRVAVMLPNCIDMILLFFALSKLGAVMVPLNIYLKGNFLTHQLRDSGARMVVCDDPGWQCIVPVAAQLDALESAIFVGPGAAEAATAGCHGISIHDLSVIGDTDSPCPDVPLTMHDLLIIMYTSGTTGAAKGCMLSHGYYMAQTWSDIKAGMLLPTDLLYSAMPLFHAAAGVRQLGQALAVGAPTCFDARFSASNFMNRAVELGATWVSMVAAMFKAVLAQPTERDRRDHGIRYITANAVSAEDQEEFEQRFAVVTSTLGFGQTEGMAFTKAHLDMAQRKRGTVGHAGYFYDIGLLDDDGFPVPDGEPGEICVRPREPEMMFSGYWRQPEKTIEAFRGLWYHTGDLATRDADGFFNFVGRKLDRIRRRGENVSVIEVEGAIARHPAVSQVAIHAVPSAMGEDDIKACLVLHAGHDLDIAELFAFMKRNLPYFAMPRFVEVLDELPLTATTGRIMKKVLRDRGVGAAVDLEALGLVVNLADRRG